MCGEFRTRGEQSCKSPQKRPQKRRPWEKEWALVTCQVQRAETCPGNEELPVSLPIFPPFPLLNNFGLSMQQGKPRLREVAVWRGEREEAEERGREPGLAPSLSQDLSWVSGTKTHLCIQIEVWAL